MGSGKSTIGKLLSEKLKMKFIDLDKHIEQKSEKTITEIFSSDGEEKFRVMEQEYLNNLLQEDNAVISLGGGTPCFHNNIEFINKNGTSVYIEMNADALVKRLSQEKDKRPLIRNLNEVELKYFIEKNLEKRLPVYRQAHLSVATKNLNAEQVAEIIRRCIGNES